LDQASKGVFLPATESSVNLTGGAVHRTLHTAYYEVVKEMLGAATTREEVLIVLDSIRKARLSGGL
jgi:hypothetical protein